MRVRGPSFGLALGAGGMRGAAHIGVLKVLQCNGLEPCLLAGSSAGALVGALYAGGWSATQLEQLARDLDAKKVYRSNLSFSTAAWMLGKVVLDRVGCDLPYLSSPLGAASLEPLRAQLKRWLPAGGFDQLPRPLLLVATDLDSGAPVIFGPRRLVASLQKEVSLVSALNRRGIQAADVAWDVSVAEAVCASCAIPVVFEPVEIAGRTLVDGGVVAHVPAEFVNAALGGRGPTVAVSLGFAPESSRVDNILELAERSLAVMGTQLSELQMAQFADLVVRPETGSVGLTDHNSVPSLVRAGAQAMEPLVRGRRPWSPWFHVWRNCWVYGDLSVSDPRRLASRASDR